jgi:hypothetical protein
MDKDTKNKLMELIGEYWDLAYQEGEYGVSRHAEANRVLSTISSLLSRPIAVKVPHGTTHMDTQGNYYCAGDTCVWSIWDPLSNQWVSTEMSDKFIQTSMYRVISVPDYQKELDDKAFEGFVKAIEH